MNAIDIKPTANDAYLGLIEFFKSDTVFTVEEEEQLKKKMTTNFTNVAEDDTEYADLAFEIGKLYWYYYDYGRTENNDNQITRMKSSTQWFEDAVTYGTADRDYYEMAIIYRDIGKFNAEINSQIEEASDKGLYLPYWENIQSLLTLVEENPDESELVKLELYKLAANAIENYARKFKADGVKEKEIRAVFETVKKSTVNVVTTTDKTETMKNEIINRFETIEKSITNAYRNQGG